MTREARMKKERRVGGVVPESNLARYVIRHLASMWKLRPEF